MKFAVDANLGRLAKELRALGFDTLYYRGKDFHEMIQLARRQERVILTRNERLTPETTEVPIIHISQDDPAFQLKELLRRKVIALDDANLFSRCLLCNTQLDEIQREQAEGKVPDYVYQHQREFYRCSKCLRLYWPGTHLDKMKKRLDQYQKTL